MAEIDTTQEWQRLQELYGSMSEEELEAVANDGYELTDIAKQALTAEISRRHLQVVVRFAPPPEEPEPQDAGDKEFNPADLDLAQAWSVENKDEAEWVKTTLKDAGIPCYFGPDLVEDVSRLDFAQSAFVGVQVLDTDLERTRYALRGFDEHFGKHEEELADLTVHCPKCHSTEVVFWGRGSVPSEESEATPDSDDTEESENAEQLETTAPGSKFDWSCDACGYKWEDDGVES